MLASADELRASNLSDLRWLAVIGNGNYPAALREIGEVEAAGRTLGIEVDKFEIRRAEDIAPAFEAFKDGSQAPLRVLVRADDNSQSFTS